MRIFISYTTRDHRDRALARQISDGLLARGVEVFFAPTAIRAGAKWKDELRAEISARCSHILVIISPASVASKEVLEEIALARARAAADPAFTILPLVTGTAVDNPLSDFDWVDYSDDRADQVENIARELGLPPQTEYDRAFAPVILWGNQSTGGGDLVPRLCDRRDQEHTFRSAFQAHLRRRARAPQVYFISGGEGEKHTSLVDRFRWTFMSSFAAEVKRDPDASVSLDTVPWAISTKLDEAIEELLAELFGVFDSGYLRDGRALTAAAFVKLTQGRPEPIIAVQHEIRSQSWNRITTQLIERYLRFWSEVADLKPAPQFVVFFNLVLCDSDERNAEALNEFVQSLTEEPVPSKPFWKRLGAFLGDGAAPRTPLPQNVAVTPLPPLQGVRREDVDDWFDQRLQGFDFKKRESVCDELFRSAPFRRMADVERRLAAIFNDYHANVGQPLRQP